MDSLEVFEQTAQNWADAWNDWYRQMSKPSSDAAEALRSRAVMHGLEKKLRQLSRSWKPELWEQACETQPHQFQDTCSWVRHVVDVPETTPAYQDGQRVTVTAWLPWSIISDHPEISSARFNEGLEKAIQRGVEQAKRDVAALQRYGACFVEGLPRWSTDRLPPLGEWVDDPLGDGHQPDWAPVVEATHQHGVAAIRLWADDYLNLAVLRDAISGSLEFWHSELVDSQMESAAAADDDEALDALDGPVHELVYIEPLVPEPLEAVAAIESHRWTCWFNEHVAPPFLEGVSHRQVVVTISESHPGKPESVAVLVRDTAGGVTTTSAAYDWKHLRLLEVDLSELLSPFLDLSDTRLTWTVAHATPVVESRAFRLDEALSSQRIH
jgi:hypothetical protein